MNNTFFDNSLYEMLYYYKKYRFKYGNSSTFAKIDDLEKILNSRNCKLYRCRKKIIYASKVRKYSYFVTFTFDDDMLFTSDKFQRQYIYDTLKLFDSNCLYILNVDYGKTTHRKHFHCFVSSNFDNLDSFLKDWYQSFTKTESVNFTDIDYIRVSKYIDKLCNHATKSTTCSNSLYSNFNNDKLYHSSDIRFLQNL